MASQIKDPSGSYRIQFYAPDGSRKSIRLGKCSKNYANEVTVKTEKLLAARITGEAPDRQTALWLSELTPALREKLQRADLIDAKATVTLDRFLDDFLERHGANKKPATRIVWGQVMKMLRQYMPADLPIEQITTGHAKKFVSSLKARGLASATVSKRVGFARQFFQDAVDWELIDRNPFASVKTSTSSLKSNVNVPAETIRHVLRHCDTTWATIIGLSRFGGLRCPSEVLSLKWCDIDWENGRMSVPEPKVEHHEGRGVRSVPLFPELRQILDKAFAVAADGAEYVVDKPSYRAAAMRPGGWANANLRTQFLKILQRAGIVPWARLFHSMRASRQTELERDHPRHVVCAWMGNTAAVAEKSYLLVTDGDFERAVRPSPDLPESCAKSGAVGVKNGAKSVLQGTRREQAGKRKNPGKDGENGVFNVFSGVSKMEDRGRDESPENPVFTGFCEGICDEVALNQCRKEHATIEQCESFQALVRGWGLLDPTDRAEVRAMVDRLVEDRQEASRRG